MFAAFLHLLQVCLCAAFVWCNFVYFGRTGLMLSFFFPVKLAGLNTTVLSSDFCDPWRETELFCTFISFVLSDKIIIIVIAFKGTIRDWWTVSNMYTQVARSQLCANHVQHIERLWRATCRVMCHVVWMDSSAIKFDRAEIAFIWALFYWLNR